MHSNLQQVHDIAAVCATKGIKRVVLSPGSRCAPITISFARHPEIETFVVPDERSAAFIALGMALETKETIALVCTSGTAAINYYPAITEAYYQQVPLLVLTADRPPELIDQGDGQTIRQEKLYANHIKRSFSFPIDQNLALAHQIVADAIDSTQNLPQGPVHINIPIREPFYPDKLKKLHFSSFELKERGSHQKELKVFDSSKFHKVLILAGQNEYSIAIKAHLDNSSAPIICESISNLPELEKGVYSHDLFLPALEEFEKPLLQPDLLITIGNAILSKPLKQFLRNNKPAEHWNFSNQDQPADVFQSITHHYPLENFLDLKVNQLSSNSSSLWLEKCRHAQQHIQFSLDSNEWNEFICIQTIIASLPKVCIIHVANSMSIRYVNYLTSQLTSTQIIRCNRGTSGIDGSISTAMGGAICSSDVPNIIITGDLSFFYDRNAFWHNHKPNNLTIFLMNNHGGGIFRMIDGPANLPEHEIFFETPQNLNGENTAKDFQFDYSLCKNQIDLNQALKEISNKLIEIETDTVTNTAFLKKFKQTYNKH